MQHSTLCTLLLLLLLLGSSDCFVLRQTCSIRSFSLAADVADAAVPPSSGIKVLLQQDMKTAMKAKDKERLAGIRLYHKILHFNVNDD